MNTAARDAGDGLEVENAVRVFEDERAVHSSKQRRLHVFQRAEPLVAHAPAALEPAVQRLVLELGTLVALGG